MDKKQTVVFQDQVNGLSKAWDYQGKPDATNLKIKSANIEAATANHLIPTTSYLTLSEHTPVYTVKRQHRNVLISDEQRKKKKASVFIPTAILPSRPQRVVGYPIFLILKNFILRHWAISAGVEEMSIDTRTFGVVAGRSKERNRRLDECPCKRRGTKIYCYGCTMQPLVWFCLS